jgi:hypothetical protein
MSDSFLSFSNSSNFRNQLIARNLAPYNVPGVFSSNQSNSNYETNLTVSSVIDSSDTLISTNNLANSLYPLNEYGPEGGFDGKYSVPGSPYPVESNSGPYNPDDTNLDIINEFFIDAAYVQNIYGPEGGYENLVTITDVVGPAKLYQPYWDPSSFVASTYSPYDLIFSQNPTGSNGPLSQDTYLAKIGAQQLKSAFEERIAQQVKKQTVGRINLDSLEDPFSASLVAAGKEPFIEKNWTITQPENPIEAAAAFATRLSGTYFPVSTIPGSYFNDVNFQAPKLEKALNVGNSLTGGLLGPILDVFRNPSETFVANTGNGQRSILFSTLDYNKYRPKYTRGPIQSITTGLDRILDPNKPNTGGYYVGSPEAEPSQIDSPANQIPVGPGGKQINTIVYGPQELGILYEGNENLLLNGLKGKSITDGGGTSGQFVWTSPKYKDNAGFKQGPGGQTTNLDEQFESIRSDYSKYQSTDIPFKEGSILDDTQRLIESADKVTGQSRLKHVGNAINQVSKVFNDGYKELTKGSQVLSYKNDSDGSEAGIEYCRVFTKDTPYYTYGDLQKTDGITTEGRKFTYSVFDKTYNLNIAPLKNPGSTNIFDNKVKKYMFSIENLAWRTSDRPGFTYDDLPVCERGPNGGRIMWFPPYGLTFNDDSKPQFNATTFLGRPEPIYTYKNTSRSGSISWKIVVDHPSVMNTIVQKQLKNIDPAKVNSMIDSFFAGCLKYDLYELGIKFNTIPTRDLFTYQQVLNNPRLTSEELGQVAFEIPKDEEINAQTTNNANNVTDNGGGTATEVKKTEPIIESVDLSKYEGFGLYFDNDCPECKSSTSVTASQPYTFWYNQYTGKKTTYSANAPEKVFIDNGNTEFSRDGISDFFSQVVEGNFNIIEKELLKEVKDILSQDGTVTIELQGSASAVASVPYNDKLSRRRIDSVIKWLRPQTDPKGQTLGSYIDTKKLIIKQDPRGETITIPKTKALDSNTGDTQTVVDQTGNQGILSASVNCNSNVQVKINNVLKTTTAAEIYSIPAMACRRVSIKKINASRPKPEEVKVVTETTTQPIGGGNENPKITPSDTIKPTPNITIEQKIKDGISKKILRFLFSECDYFEVLKESDPMIYQSIKDKIKHFHPAFHAITPEGLNARLTFLNQCVRPGQTIPIIGADGRPKYNDALNTSFGAPPILVLRVGDFYHSKIVPNSLTFKYGDAQYDINPEGIGIQPMIVDVTLSFDFIGGHGLKQPIEELQNALSFNFYANTEIYDERATATEDTSERDKYVVEKILSNQPPVTTLNVTNEIPKKGGNTIGTIISDTEIDYTSKITQFWESTKKYFEAYIDFNVSVMKNFNIGIVDLLYSERDYTKGSFDEYGTPIEIEIYGKPKNMEDKVNKLFEKTINDISDKKGPFIENIYNTNGLKDKDKREVETRLKLFVESLRQDFSVNLNNEYTNFTIQQQDYIQYIRQFNLILIKIDGEKLGPPQAGPAKVFSLSGDTFEVLKNTILKIKDKHLEFYNGTSLNPNENQNSIVKKSDRLNLRTNYYNKNESTFFDEKGIEEVATFARPNNNQNPANRFYQVTNNIFSNENKKNEFRSFLLNSNVYENKALVETAINSSIVLCTELFKIYDSTNNKFYSEIKTKPDYLKLIESPITDNQKFILNYTSKIENSGTNRDIISNTYLDLNLNSDFNTFNGKVKFN